MAIPYVKNTFVNDSAPALNATNMNNISDGIEINNRLDLATIRNITADADYTLTASENQYGNVTITDTGVVLTGAVNIIVNTDEHSYVFKNETAQILTVKTLAGTGIVVPSGGSKKLRNDTVNVIDFEAGLEVGTTYIDPDAIGANPTAKIYNDGTVVGSTDNGAYVKYANGGLLCSDTAVGSAGTIAATFPVAFIVKATVTATVVGGDDAQLWTVSIRSSTPTSSVSLKVRVGNAGSQSNSTADVHWIAIGRWK